MSAGPEEGARAEAESALKDELRRTSASFRKKRSRHWLSTANVIYCAFATPGFAVRREEAQRDAARRLEQFGVTPEDIRGKRLLDLGCNNGAMLLQLSNYAPAWGLGVEYAPEKVQPLAMPRLGNDFTTDLKKILGSYNVASKHWIIRQYDHEVLGGSVVKPLVGAQFDGPSDAAVVESRRAGLYAGPDTQVYDDATAEAVLARKPEERTLVNVFKAALVRHPSLIFDVLKVFMS